jgi:MFS family permease
VVPKSRAANRGEPRGAGTEDLELDLIGVLARGAQEQHESARLAIDVRAQVSAGAASWIITAYLLSASVLTPVLGRLGDMVGKRRVLIAA